jgi:hypothetical protein
MYIGINTRFTFEVSKSDDQSILAAIVPCTAWYWEYYMGTVPRAARKAKNSR